VPISDRERFGKRVAILKRKGGKRKRKKREERKKR